MKNQQLCKLLQLGSTNGDVSEFNEKLGNFTLRGAVIEHPIFTRAIREIARLHMRGKVSGVSEGMLLVAQTGSGKTTVLKYYENRFPRHEDEYVTKIPVLRIDTPESPTVKSFAEAILYAMKDPAADSGTTLIKTNRIVHLFKQCGVELLLIDEFQHFYDGQRKAECKRVSDWLKNLINKVDIPVILAGLPRAISIVNSNPQLRRRFGAPHYLKPFGFETKNEQMNFRAILKNIQDGLPVSSVDLSEANLAQRFYYATHGLLDYVVKIIDDAVSRRRSDQKTPLTQYDFAKAFKRTVWLDAPDSLNPFLQKGTFRLLNKPLEPFDIWDDIKKYTTTLKRLKTQL